MTDTATQILICVYCRQGYGPGDEGNCIDGNACVVTPKDVLEKTYYLSGPAPQRSGRTEQGKPLPIPETEGVDIHGVPPSIYPPNFSPTSGQDESVLNGRWVRFTHNRYTTSDPVERYWLDKMAEDNPGKFCAEKEWKAAWLTAEELYEQEKAEFERLKAEVAQLKKGAR